MRAFICASIVVLASSAWASDVVLSNAVALKVPSNPRSAIRRDPVESAVLRLRAGNPYPLVRMDWKPVKAGADGVFTGDFLEGGYVWAKYNSPDDRVVYLEASGASVAYANWAPRAGDPYSFGYVSLPVKLRKGRNDFLFSCGRGRLAAKLVDASGVALDARDLTLPDIAAGAAGEYWAGVVAKNPTASSARIEVFDVALGSRTTVTLRPMSCTKVGVRLAPTPGAHTIMTNTGAKLDVKVGEAKPGAPYKVTFRSAVDDSIQYFGVNPSSHFAEGQALFLSLHGASVEAIGQAQAYGPHDWGTLVAATNRRPFGFDWEEVGRLDALEVLAEGTKRFSPDPNRIYLTGHSMGGHGTWSVGSLFPDKFAAIMPSAGWISFSTYAGGATYRDSDPVEKLLGRANSVYDTLARKQNLFMPGVYVLHGDADDNVPVDQARTMIKELAGHPNLKWHEEKGAGHWWDKDPAPGADCVDWKPGFELFKTTERPDAALKVNFTTPDPWISATCRWVRIGEQAVPLQPSSVDLHADYRTVTGSTANVASLSLAFRQLETVELDGQKLALYGVGPYGFERVEGKWRVVPSSSVRAVPHGAKAVFANHVTFVVGTGGTVEEQEATREAAQYWQETYQYRGNAGVAIMTDREAVQSGFAAGGGNVVLFGRPDTNRLWNALASRFAVRLGPGAVSGGGRRATGDDLAFVGLADLGRGRLALGVGGTGPTGLRLVARTPIFTSGAAYSDTLVWSPRMLESGSAGVVMAGFNAGSFSGPELVWR